MSEKEPQFFRPGEAAEKERREKPIEKLKEFIRKTSMELREGGFPINREGRIVMDEFRKIYGEESVRRDKKHVEELKEIWLRRLMAKLPQKGPEWCKKEALRIRKRGEELEILKTAIFDKNLGDRFITLRTSEYDDIKNNIDNIILDKDTGNIVCALDEVVGTSGRRFEKKQEQILEKNLLKKGGFLKYGTYLERKKGKMELRRGKIDNLPIFYFALSEDELDKRIEAFNLSHESSPCEKELFAKFINSAAGQIEDLRSKKGPWEGQLHPKVRERLELFEKIINMIQPR